MADSMPIKKEDVEALAGHLPECGELLGLLLEQPGLVVVAGDPLSGTSALVATVQSVLADEGGVYLRCDARSCLDSLDLARAIGDSVIHALAQEAEAWWLGEAAPASTAGLRLMRALNEQGTDLRDLQHGRGQGRQLLADALDMLAALASRPTLIVDHLGLLVASLDARQGGELLSELRAGRQRHPSLDLVLVEHRDGPIASALHDPGHPLFQAGEVVRIRRPRPARFAADIAVTPAWSEVRTEGLTDAAELAAGVPALTWQTHRLAQLGGRAIRGWRALRQATDTSTAQQWDLLRGVHRQAQPVVAAMSVGLRPHSVDANPKSVNDALVRLRELGHVWQPEERNWSVSNPLLRAWARDHAPSWARHRGARD
jgi:hypothetical protein